MSTHEESMANRVLNRARECGLRTVSPRSEPEREYIRLALQEVMEGKLMIVRWDHWRVHYTIETR